MLYYPHEVTPDMGPTALVPKTQYYMDGPSDEIEGLPLTCAAGTVGHHPLRIVAPGHGQSLAPDALHAEVPLCPHPREHARTSVVNGCPQDAMQLCTARCGAGTGGRPPPCRSGQWKPYRQLCATPDERVRIDAYYDLGTLGAEGVPVLMAALKRRVCPAVGKPISSAAILPIPASWKAPTG